MSGRFESGHGDPISAAQRQNHGIPIGFHVTLAAGVLAIASPLGDGWLAMLDSYIRAFLSSAATSFIC